ncbi:MAG: RNA polymerase sigma factor [Solirubrobacterales bacterium]
MEQSVEVSTLRHNSAVPGLRGASALLRLQSDERLVALTRRGQHAAFEVLCSRYQTRLLSFCRHMLGSREDAEDVLQEVFAAAFNAVLADEREINVRPWLYRIARNRSLNHLRRASAVGVDSMDVHFADHGLSTGDRVLRRESFRELLGDVRQLPETQRTALLLREIDALSYDQIADAMETTVPSVKSLLVRARISLAEAAEARKLSCDEVRLELGEVAEGLVKLSSPARRHVRDCERCRFFKKHLKDNNQALAALLPVGPLLLVKKLLLAKLGSASSAHVAGGASATMGAGAAAGTGAAGGAGAAGGIFTVGAGALATKAVAGLAAAAIVSAGAVAANQASHHHHKVSAASASVPITNHVGEPVIVSERSQPVSPAFAGRAITAAHHSSGHRTARTVKTLPTAVKTLASGALPTVSPAVKPTPAKAEPAATQVTQVTTETTQLPATTTGEAPPSASTTASTTTPAPPAPTPATPATPSSTEPAPPSGGETAPMTAPSTTTTPAPPPPPEELAKSAQKPTASVPVRPVRRAGAERRLSRAGARPALER